MAAPTYNSQGTYIPTATPTTSAPNNSVQTMTPYAGTYVNPQTGTSNAWTSSLPQTPAGGPATSTPVVTSQNAQTDSAQKLAAFTTMQANNATQAQKLAQQQAQANLEKMAQDQQTQQQKNIDTQNAQKQQEIDAKNTALGIATTSPNNNQTTPTNTTTASAQNNAPTGNISPTGGSTDVTQQGLQTATDQYTQGQSDIQSQKEQLSTQMSDQLNNLLNGTIPLTTTQQSLVTSLNTQLVQNEAAQNVANQAYVGQVSEAAFRAGGEYTNQQMSGQIANAISYGVSKISALDNAAAKTTADLEQSFQKSNFDIINQQYSLLSKQLDDKSAELKNTYDAVTKQLTDQRTYNMDLAKFAQTQDQNAFDNALKTEAQVFDEKYKNETLAQNQEKIDASNPSAASGIMPAALTSNGAVDKNSQQQVFGQISSQYGIATATAIQQIANYKGNLNNFTTRAGAGMNRSMALGLATLLNPNFSQADYNSRQTLQTSFTSGKYSQNVNALNTAVGHITDILQNTKGLGNGSFVPANMAKNAMASMFGSGAVGKANLNIQAATAELATVFKGSGATDQEIKNLGSLSSDSSPDQVKAYIETATQLMGSRLNALNDTYTSGMGQPPDSPFLSSTSQAALMGLQKQGLNIQVPELANSPITKIQSFHDSSPENATTYDSLVKQFPTATPDQIMQALNLQ